jgi:hypothetical protein
MLRAGDVIIALNGVPTASATVADVRHKLLRLCFRSETWVTVARPVGRAASLPALPLAEPVTAAPPAAAAAAAESEGSGVPEEQQLVLFFM